MTASVNLFGPAERIGRSIKEQIASQTQLTASVGVAPNKFLAKLASDLKKPDGFVVITEQEQTGDSRSARHGASGASAK